MKKISITLILSALWIAASAQKKTWYCSDSIYCETGVDGMALGKFLYFNYTMVPDFAFRKNAETPTGEPEIRRVWEFKGSLKLPLVIKDKFKMFIGASYLQEEYRFKERIDTPDVVEVLEEKNLKSASLNLYFLIPRRDNRYIYVRSGNTFNGDYGGIVKPSFLYFSSNMIFMGVFKRNKKLELGAGFIANYGLQGTFRGIPMFWYNHTFSPKVGIEAMLPIEVNLRFNLSKSTLLYTGGEIEMNSYRLNGGDLTSDPNTPVVLQKTTLKTGIALEQRILPSVGIALAMGYMRTLNLDVTLHSPKDELVQIAPDNSIYFRVSLFFTTPEKLLVKATRKHQEQEQLKQQLLEKY